MTVKELTNNMLKFSKKAVIASVFTALTVPVLSEITGPLLNIFADEKIFTQLVKQKKPDAPDRNNPKTFAGRVLARRNSDTISPEDVAAGLSV